MNIALFKLGVVLSGGGGDLCRAVSSADETGAIGSDSETKHKYMYIGTGYAKVRIL